MNGVLLVPTLNRTGLLRNFLGSCRATEVTIPIWLLVDDSDYRKNLVQYTDCLNDFKDLSLRLINTGGQVTMGDKVREVFKEAKEFKWIGLLNDDHFCLTNGWDKLADEMLDGTNFISTNDGSWNFGLFPVGLTAWSTKLLETCGFPIFPPGINHWFIDNAWKLIGEGSGCWEETLTINIEHRHAFIGKMEQDDTFKASQDQAKATDSFQNFNRFVQNDLPEVIKKVSHLRLNKTTESKFV